MKIFFSSQSQWLLALQLLLWHKLRKLHSMVLGEGLGSAMAERLWTKGRWEEKITLGSFFREWHLISLLKKMKSNIRMDENWKQVEKNGPAPLSSSLPVFAKASCWPKPTRIQSTGNLLINTWKVWLYWKKRAIIIKCYHFIISIYHTSQSTTRKSNYKSTALVNMEAKFLNYE